GHSYEAVVTEATCTEGGYTTYTCTVCGDSYIADETEANGHTAGEAVTENLVEATCTEDGSYDSVVYCSVCGEELSRETVTVSATGHNYENGVCTVCGAQESGSGSGSGGSNSGSIWQNFRDWMNNFFGRWN
ncbi:MAG: hypothetical protein LUF34_05830, partial [Lachnospiraceae bacterium]|nr:hypothetical protein [Lachnospiraceae bacterium]